MAISASASMRSASAYSSIRCAYVESSTASSGRDGGRRRAADAPPRGGARRGWQHRSYRLVRRRDRRVLSDRSRRRPALGSDRGPGDPGSQHRRASGIEAPRELHGGVITLAIRAPLERSLVALGEREKRPDQARAAGSSYREIVAAWSAGSWCCAARPSWVCHPDVKRLAAWLAVRSRAVRSPDVVSGLTVPRRTPPNTSRPPRG